MRDPTRIPEILDKIKELWQKMPDLRLGQLLCNICESGELYYLEDEDLVKRLEAKNSITF